MNVGLKRFAEQVLFASNIFIAFLLFFESRLVIPIWLQTIGRIHPLILHFPIVMLLIAMLMEFFRFKPQYSANTFYRNFLQNFLLIGALFAAVTVIMGLFLSKEEGYAGQTLMWHKWTGAAIFFIASFIYWIHHKNWYKAPVAKVCASIVVIGLVLTGHYGAALTHGEDFIFEPILSNRASEAVPVDKAIVFDDVILPILEQKCVSCHNADKIKGELMLTDAKSMLKGGKSGKLFVPGNPKISLLLQRVHMPLDEKKHMPPAGKSQLTAQEIRLLALWVKADANFKMKLTALPPDDSLRMLSTTRLSPAESQEEKYDFDAVDEETIAKLNNDYRRVAVLSKESPAISVNIYSRAAYSVKQLDDLNEIKKQIVSLNLNKMPVKDADLKSISKFENLRKLDLNFTAITADGLRELSALKHLHTLTLSGTRVNFKGLAAQLPALKALKTISIWETQLSVPEVSQLQKANKSITIIGGFKDDGKAPLKLNPPQLKNSSAIFDHRFVLQLKHPISNVEIRFTTDGTEPDSVKSPVFESKTIIEANTTIKAKAYKAGWFGSDMATFDFFKSAYSPDSVTILFPLSRVHRAEMDKTFFNHKLGAIGANNPAWANNWAGVRDNDMGIVAEFKKPVAVSSVGLRYMIEEAREIFPPKLIEVWGGTERNNLKLLTKFKAPMPSLGDVPTLKTVEGKFKTQTISYLKIIAKPVSKIPAWHKSKGNKALLLVDEMFIN